MKPWLDRVNEAAQTIVHQLKFNPRLGRLEPATGTWSPAFLEHGLVQQAEAEGWGRELRAYVLATVKRKIMGWRPEDKGQGTMPAFEEIIRDVDTVMPKDTEWIAYTRQQAAITTDIQYGRDPIDHELTERLVREFKRNPANASALLKIALTKRDRKIPFQKLRDVSKPAFEEMQQESPNKGIHMTRVGYSEHLRRAIRGELTETSRRMTGEHDE